MIVKEGYQLLYDILIKKYISDVSSIEDHEGTIYFFIGDGSAGDATENDVYVQNEIISEVKLTKDIIDIASTNRAIIIRHAISEEDNSMTTTFTVGSAGIFVELSDGEKILFSRITFDPITLLTGSVIDIEYIVQF